MNIIERREIEFTAEGVVDAITSAIDAAQSIGIPGLPPSGVRFEPEQGVVRLVYGSGRASRMLALPGESLAALLISFCVRSGVPMPRFSDKSVRIEPHAVVIAFCTEIQLAGMRPATHEQPAAAPAKIAPVGREIGWAS